jgi:diguanylate cyclase (GGDEF)-like protein
VAQRTGDRVGAATAELNAGWALIFLGRYDEAVGRLNGAREGFSTISDRDGVMKSTNALGVLSFRIGESEQAREFFEEGLRLARADGNADRRIAALNNLGELSSSLGDHDAALGYYRQALEEARHEDDSNAQAVIQMNIGRVKLEQGRWEDALHELQDALERAVAVSDRMTEAEALTQLGRGIALRHGGSDPDGEAEELHLQSIELCEELGDSSGAISALEHLAELLISLERLEEAELHLRRAVDMANESDARVTAVGALTALTERLEAAGDLEKALSLSRWVFELQQEHAGRVTARRVRALRARYELDQARMEAEIVRLRNVELRQKSEALEVSNRKLQLMHRIGSELTSTFDLEEIARRLHDRLNELMRADVFGVAFYRESDQMLDFALVIEDNQRITPFLIPVTSEESFGSWVIRNRREINLTNADHQYRTYVTKRRPFTTSRCRSIIFLPLELEGRVIGVLTVQSRRKEEYDDDTLDLLRLLSPYVAVALENSRKLQTINELNTALQQEKQQLQEAYHRIAHMANHDILTQLPNRRLLVELIHDYIPLARRQAKQFGLLYVDLDDFKPINDTFGHDVGDQVLVRIADRLRSTVRQSDTVARIGGDEFILIVRDVGGVRDIVAVAEKVLSTIGQPITVADQICRLAASIGVSVFPQHGETYDDLVIAADHAMYAAKEAGKSGISIAKRGSYRSRTSSRDDSIESSSNTNLPST